MPVIIFDGVNASMTVGSDTFSQNAVMSRYVKGKNRKVMAMAIIGGTVGTGKWDLMYGADYIAQGLQSSIATDDFLTTRDYQSIVDKRWCGKDQQLSLVCTEAPAEKVRA